MSHPTIKNRRILAALFLLSMTWLGLLVPQPAIADGSVWPTATYTVTSTPVSTLTPSITPILPTEIPTEAIPAVNSNTSGINTTDSVDNAAPVSGFGWLGYLMIFIIVVSWLAIIGLAVYYFFVQSQGQDQPFAAPPAEDEDSSYYGE